MAWCLEGSALEPRRCVVQPREPTRPVCCPGKRQQRRRARSWQHPSTACARLPRAGGEGSEGSESLVQGLSERRSPGAAQLPSPSREAERAPQALSAAPAISEGLAASVRGAGRGSVATGCCFSKISKGTAPTRQPEHPLHIHISITSSSDSTGSTPPSA